MSQDTSSWFSGFWERCSNSVVGEFISPSVTKPSDDDTIINRSIYVPESDTSRNDGGEVSNGSEGEATGIEKLLDNEGTKQKCIATFKYLEESEATKSSEKTKSAAKLLCKDYQGDEDWTKNHFLRNEIEEKDKDTFDFILDSYQFDELVASCAKSSELSNDSPVYVSTGQEKGPYYLRLEGLLSLATCCPSVTNGMKVYYESLRNNNLDNLPEGCRTFDGFLGWLDQDENFVEFAAASELETDIKEEIMKEVLAYIKSSIRYRLAIKLKEVYMKLLTFKSKSTSSSLELVIGFGHLRMRYKIESRGVATTRIVNGPLYEIVVDVHRDENDDSITILPQPGAKVRVNRQVVAALIASEGANEDFLQNVYDEAKAVDPESIYFGDEQTYSKLLDRGKYLHAFGKVPTEQDMIHVIPNEEEGLVINAAWCLFIREKLSTVHSRAARGLIESFESGKLKLTKGLYALMEGPSVLDSFRKTDGDGEVQLVYPLPTSQAQREIGKRLLVEKMPVVIVDGPPGNGKTHSIVSYVSAALTLGLKILITSKNQRALESLMDKVPEEFRPLCLDMSCYEDADGLSRLQNALEKLAREIQKTKHQQEGKQETVEELEEQIKTLKTKLRSKDDAAKVAASKLNELLKSPKAKIILEIASKLTAAKFSWIVHAAVGSKNFDAIMQPTSFLASRAKSFQETCVDDLDDIPQELDQQVSMRAKEKPPTEGIKMETGKRMLRPVSAQSVKESAGSILSKIRLDGKSPTTPEEWRRVQQDLIVRKQQLEFMKKYVEPFLALGYQQSDILGRDVDEYVYLQALEKGKELENLKNDLDTENRAKLESVVDAISITSGADNQAQRRELANEIQAKEADYVFNKVLLTQSDIFSYSNMADLNKLIQATRNRLEDTDSTSKKRKKDPKSEKNKKAQESKNIFKQAFQGASKFMPFIVMTTDQASELLSPTQTFDIGIIDEASQADCTALIVMAHCKQLCVVGDDKQNSPCEANGGVERTRYLTNILPDMICPTQLLPKYSFFDLVKIGFPYCSTFLNEHFRSVPGIIACSNKLFYGGTLEPLRLPTNDSPIAHIRVKGTQEKHTNQKECDEIIKLIGEHIDDASKGLVKSHSIGVISMDGPQQKDLIEAALEKKYDEWSLKYGKAALKLHRISVGEPTEFQSDERDLVFISGVNDDRLKKLRVDEDQRKWRKRWNVALTRAKNKMVFVHSFDKEHTEEADVRRDILEFFLEAEKDGQVLRRQHTSPTSSRTVSFAKNPTTEQMIKDELIQGLKERGFNVSLKGGHHWGGSLCVGRGGSDVRALVSIENSGERPRVWQERVHEQLSLERAGRHCLRVDFITLVLRYRSTLEDVLRFLKQIGLEASTPSAAATGSKDDPMDFLDGDAKPAQDETIDSTKTTEAESNASEESSWASAEATKKKSGKIPSSSSSSSSNKRKQKQTATSKKTTTARKSSSSSKKKQRV